ncbi:ATP-binding protein [Deinococcus sp. RM]|uniref:ATP-binding protein n=1 Tax=Deinococcus sp. RM TaxID=2316359 RepID=UPI000E687093|nr:ATP-binding protein [Deinococcus sp. RM]RIY03850.1 ATP-binding protein [Deinococcus sp. RM]
MSGIVFPWEATDGQPASQSIYTYEGWRLYVNAPVMTPLQLPTLAEYRALPLAGRQQLDQARLRYVMGFGPLSTPALKQVGEVLKRHIRINMQVPTDQVKVGVVIDGHAAHGKTTIAKTIARQFERMIRREAIFADPAASDLFIPVVHVTLLRSTTPKGLALAICQFLNVPLRGKETEQQLVSAVQQAVIRHRILLFVIDDIHFLQPRSKEGKETSNFLKSLMNLTGATFLYIGIDVESMGFLQEHGAPSLASSQTAARFVVQRVRPFGKEDQVWRLLLREVERHMCLLDQPPGTLEHHYRLIYNRTGGSIGSLMNLLRNAALGAIGGTERVTAAELRQAELDYAATVQGSLEDS